MSVTQSANPRDVQDFQFKNFCRLRIFQRHGGTYKSSVSLVATASKYDLIFVGCPNGFQVITSSSIQELANAASSGNEIVNYPRREVVLGSQPSHLNVSCDQNRLVVAITKDGCAHAIVYSVTSFLSKDVVVENEVRLSTKVDTPVLDLTWNPGIPNILAACLSDGGMAAYEFKQNSVDISTLPPATQATCFCWSPKGKQLVVGADNGTLTQYKPDLKAVKTFSAPSLGSGNIALVNVVWLSNYQFAGIYRDKGNPDERPGLLIVNAPKAGPVTFINYEDICYSVGELRPPQFYLLHQAIWNVLMVASANSMEVGVMGLQEDQVSWEQWTQEDAARAELPLMADKQETYPIGMALDTSSQQELPWGENQTLPPMPVLHILSHDGLLCLFHTLNLRSDAPRLCSAPEPLPDQSGIAQFVTSPSSAVPLEQISKPAAPETNVHKIGFKVNLGPTFESIAAATPVQPVATSAPIPAPASGMMFSMTPPVAKLPAPTGFGMFNLPSTGQTQSLAFLTHSSMKPAIPAPSAAPAFTSTPATTSSSALFALPVVTTTVQPMPVQIPIAAVKPPPPPPATAQVQPPGVTETTSAPAKVEPKQPSSVSTQAFAAAIDEEMAHFERELTQLRSRVNATNIQVGLYEEKVLLKQKVDTLEAFWKDLKETTQAQTVEIHTLKSTLMEAFAWAEEAKSRAQQLSSPTYVQLVRSQGLDPVTAHRAADIKHLVYYVENQLQQVNQQLDSRWIEFQESCNPSPRKKMQVPSLEAVYQTMVCQNNILNKQRDIMSDIARRAKHQGRNNNIPLISTTVLARARDKEASQGETELSRLAESLVQVKLGSSEESRPLQRCRQLSSRKQAQLRNILTQRSVTRICATKPTIPSGGISGGRPIVKSPQSSMPSRNGMMAEKKQQTPPFGINSIAKGTVYEDVTPPETPRTIAVDGAASVSSYSFTFTQPKADVPINTGLLFGAPLQKSPLMSLNSIVAGIGDSSASKTPPKPVASSQPKVLAATSSFSFSSFSSTQTTFGNVDVIKKPEELFRFSSNGSPATQISSAAAKEPNTTTFKTYFNASQQQGEASPKANIFGEKQATTSIFAGSKTFTQTAAAAFGGSVKSPQETPVANPAEAKETAAAKETTAVTEGVSLFGSLSVGASSKEIPGNVFGTDKESKPTQPIFGSGSVSLNIFGSKPSSTGIFGDNQNKEPPSTSTIFGGDKSSASGGLFKLNLGKDSPAAPPSIFGTNQIKESPNIFGAAQTKEGGAPSTIFGISQSKDSPSSIFGGGQGKENTPSAGIFGVAQHKDDGASSAAFSINQSKDSPSSIFGGGQAKENTLSANILSAAQFKEGSTPSTVPSTSQSKDLPSSTFSGGQTKENTPSANIFGAAQAKESGTPSTVFGTSQNKDAPSSIFGAAQAKEGAPSTVIDTTQSKDSPSSIFGSAQTKEGIPTGSIFAGGQSKDTTPTPGIFTPSQNKDSPASIFGGSAGGSNIFGENKSKEGTSIFGGSKEGTPKASENKTSVDSGNLFGNAASNLFGSLSLNKSSASEETAQQEPEKATDDNKVTSTTLEASSLEEATAPPVIITATAEAETKKLEETKTQTSSVLGGASSSFSFGQMAANLASPTSATSPQISFSFIQGDNSMPAKTSEPSGFGGSTPTTTTTAATTTTTTAATTSAASEFTFSFLGTTTASSVFGQKPLFGQPATTSTATTTVAATTTAGTTFFGQPICSPSVFGQSGGSLFGQVSSTPLKSLFGQPATTSTTSLFGGTTSAQTTTSSSLFVQSVSTSVFVQGANTMSAFGSTSGFGSKPTFGQSGGSLFGQSGGGFGSAGRSVFGGSSSGTSIFGGSSNTGGSTPGNLFQSPPSGALFGSPTTTHAASPTGGGAFSSGVGTVSQTGFGSPTAFQNKPGGFGSSPVFGSTSNTGFGGSPTFGGAPTFGGSPTFGSPNKVFGSTSPAANVSFGSAGQQSSTFESLANQNTMTFGNLAQSQPQPGFGSPQQQSVFGASTQQPPPQPAFSSANFGGSSFSSWR